MTQKNVKQRLGALFNRFSGLPLSDSELLAELNSSGLDSANANDLHVAIHRLRKGSGD